MYHEKGNTVSSLAGPPKRPITLYGLGLLSDIPPRLSQQKLNHSLLSLGYIDKKFMSWKCFPQICVSFAKHTIADKKYVSFLPSQCRHQADGKFFRQECIESFCNNRLTEYKKVLPQQTNKCNHHLQAAAWDNFSELDSAERQIRQKWANY